MEEEKNETTDTEIMEEDLATRITELEAELTETKNLYLKALADRENTRERLSKELETIQKYRAQGFLAAFLPVYDNLSRALATESTDYQKLKEGIEITVNQLQQVLANEGVTEIEALGVEFDPIYHHALVTEAEEGTPPNMVLEVLQRGYKLKDRVLRPALVKVSE